MNRQVGWDPSGAYVFSNSSQGPGLHALHVWCLATQRLVARLLPAQDGGHAGALRDLHCHPTERVLVTASYDHSVKIWRPKTP